MDVETLIKTAGGVHKLASQLGVHRTTVLAWRHDGKIPGARIGQISEAFAIPTADLAKITYPPRGRSTQE